MERSEKYKFVEQKQTEETTYKNYKNEETGATEESERSEGKITTKVEKQCKETQTRQDEIIKQADVLTERAVENESNTSESDCKVMNREQNMDKQIDGWKLADVDHVETKRNQLNSDNLQNLKPHLMLPGQSQEGEQPSSTLKSIVFTKVNKNRISAQRFPGFMKKTEVMDKRQVSHT